MLTRAAVQDVKILARTLRQLPALQTITLNQFDEEIGSKELIQAFDAFRPRDLLTYDGQYTLPIVVAALAASGAEIRNFNIGYPADFDMHNGQVRAPTVTYKCLV